MSSRLYEDCPLCKGDPRRGCLGCGGKGVVTIGLSSEQLERIVAENDRLKALARAPMAAVIIPAEESLAIDLYACDVPCTAYDLALRLAFEGQKRHSVHRVSSYHVLYGGKEWSL